MMRLLLDTHLFLWMLDDSPRLSREARSRLARPGTECCVSAVSFWEIAIKASLRRKAFRVDVSKLIDAAIASGLNLLPFLPQHAVRVAALPPHHADPFDRALIAQAQAEPLVLLTQDRQLARYGRGVSLV